MDEPQLEHQQAVRITQLEMELAEAKNREAEVRKCWADEREQHSKVQTELKDRNDRTIALDRALSANEEITTQIQKQRDSLANELEGTKARLELMTKKAYCFIPHEQLNEFKRIPAGQVLPGGLITLWENLAEHHAQKRAELEKQVAALKAQIHDMCHDLHVKGPLTVEDFCVGCMGFQIEKFGSSPIKELCDMIDLMETALEFYAKDVHAQKAAETLAAFAALKPKRDALRKIQR